MEEYDILICEKIKVDSRMYIMLASVSFVGYEGYSISFRGFLPTAIDIIVISVKFTHSSPS